MGNNIGWNLGSLVYDLFTGKIDQQLHSDVLSALGEVDGLTIDEFGCGTGILTSRFPSTAIVRAVDYSPRAIVRAREKTNGSVDFRVMDFYEEQPQGYQPDRIVACRSLYHEDLSLSLGILSRHLGEGGEVIIAHPTEKWLKYVTPKLTGKRRFNPTQLVKSMGRLANHFSVPYSLFSREEFEMSGREFFDGVSVEPAAFDTHHLVRLSKRK